MEVSDLIRIIEEKDKAHEAVLKAKNVLTNKSLNQANEIRNLHLKLEALKEEASRYYLPDGTFEVLDPETVKERRISAAQTLKHQRERIAQLEKANAEAVDRVAALKILTQEQRSSLSSVADWRAENRQRFGAYVDWAELLIILREAGCEV